MRTPLWSILVCFVEYTLLFCLFVVATLPLKACSRIPLLSPIGIGLGLPGPLSASFLTPTPWQSALDPHQFPIWQTHLGL